MRTCALFICGLLSTCALVSAQQSAQDQKRLLKVPVAFEPNRGQADQAVQYVARAGDSTLTLLDDGVGVSLGSAPALSPVRLRFEGRNPKSQWTAEQSSGATTNYLIGAEPSAWRAGVPRFERARMKNLYPGIDLVFHGTVGADSGDQLEYDFIVHPGADPRTVRYRVEGADVTLNAAGDLELSQGSLRLLHRKPAVYQTIAGKTKTIPGRFQTTGAEVRFAVDTYDRSADLIIDPVLFSTSLPGNYSFLQGVITDAAGNIYATGSVDSAYRPSAGAFQSRYGGGNQDAVVLKFSNAGTLLWATYLGGSGDENGAAVALDSAGNVIVMGQTGSADFPAAGAPLQASLGGGVDAFIAKLSPDGSKLLYRTFYGGSGDEAVWAGKLDSKGNIVIVGSTSSTNLKLAGTPYQSTNHGTPDMMIFKMSPDAATLLAATYLGGNSYDEAVGLALDASDNVYLAGWTFSSDLKTTGGVAQTASGGNTDGVVAKLDSNLTTLGFLTYLGGSGSEIAKGIAVSPDGSTIFVTGNTESVNFKTTAGALQIASGGGFDAFLVKLDSKGALLASTYVGGPGDDEGDAIVLASDGTPIFVGVITTHAYDSSDPVTLKSAASGPQTVWMNFNAGVTTVTQIVNGQTTIFYYIGDLRCGGSASFIACAGAGFPVSQTGNTAGVVAGVSMGGASLVASPNPLNFSQSIGVTSPSQAVTLTNNGTSNIKITNLKLNGSQTGFSADFTSCLGNSLSAGNSCKIFVTFTPNTTGTTTTTITVTTDVSSANQDITLNGIGVPPGAPLLSYNPVKVAFPDSVVGTLTAQTTVQISNAGTGTLTISAMALDDKTDFAIDPSGCIGKSLSGTATCNLLVQFRPTKAGALQGNVSTSSNAGNSASTLLPLNGVAIGPKQCKDNDNDGLCDDWEVNGVHFLGADGSDNFIDLPKMGANKDHKDIFIHADWMVGKDHAHIPKRGGMALAQAAFLNAPVSNPDGKNGILVHIDCGTDCVMNPATGATWGPLSKAVGQSEREPLSDTDYKTQQFDWTNFDTFATPFLNTGRKMVFHHVLFSHNQSTNFTSSGISRNDDNKFSDGASDLVVSLGGWTTDTDLIEGGTLMHELGHNLALQHGGGDGVNFKVNYLSIMNYAFQVTGLIINGSPGTLDYSRFDATDLPVIDEKNLNELSGLNGSSKVSTYGTEWFCPGDNTTATPQMTTSVNAPINWDCDKDTRGQPVYSIKTSANIVALYDKSGNSILGTMVGQNDWGVLNLKGGAIGGETGPPPTRSSRSGGPTSDITFEEAINKLGLNRLRVTAPAGVTLLPGTSLNVLVAIQNSGTSPDTFTLSASGAAGWFTSPSLPPSVTIAAGASATFPVTLTVPSSAKTADSQVIVILAKSQATPLSDSAQVLITAGTPAGGLALSASSLLLGVVPVGSSSMAAPVTLTNLGGAPVTLSGFTTAGDFSQTNTCGTSLAAGASCVLQITFNPKTAGSATGSITVSDSAPGSPHIVNLTGVGQAPAPQIGAVVNAAVNVTGEASPGELATVYGLNLSSGQNFISALPLPTTLGGTKVVVNNYQVTPLLYADANQVNIQIPYETPLGATTLTVNAPGGQLVSVPLKIVAASPGIFMIPGTQHSASQNSDYSVNLAASPAKPGGTVLMYFTGQGAVDHPVVTGDASPGDPLAYVSSTVTATVAGAPAVVSFAGMTPGLVGLAQANVVVPLNGLDGKPLPPGDYPVILTVGGVKSNAANISVGN
ncbi:MAG TPA: choice-of-anchor D domain-containing protein [Bryobacteraceae bacterium]|jgi:uncharacterized protein (TIGR03437 family)